MKDAKQIMIDKITQILKYFGEQIRTDNDTPLEEQVLQVDVLLDTLKFLEHYEENVKILNEYYLGKER